MDQRIIFWQRTLNILVPLLGALALWRSIHALEAVPPVLLAATLGLAGGVSRSAGQKIRRTMFLASFVSPGVTSFAQQRGLAALQQDWDEEISVVCVDIRNFTTFAGCNESARVMEFLREYYDAVGAIVTRYGGTIKDYAGDGILVLIGAPQPVKNHACCALQMAAAIREAAQQVTARWSRHGVPLGIGAGVASGRVTVGIVGGLERREYAAVGPAVNLAARLCSKAQSSEILLDDYTLALARRHRCNIPARVRDPLALKGFDARVNVASC